MSAFANTTWTLSRRHLRTTLRIPVFVALTLFQPIIWLLLYGQLFEKAVQIPGFDSTNYMQFLAPGVVIMTALFASIWSGMATVSDIDGGLIDRYLTTPASRLGIVVARLVNLVAQVAVQGLIILVLASIVGARPDGGIPGGLVVLAVAALVACLFGALSLGIAMLTRREETMIGVGNFLSLPLTFLSAIFIADNLMPGWMRTAAELNPLQWSVLAAREAMGADTDWGLVGGRVALLVAIAIASIAFAVWTFDRYQRTL